MIFSSWLFTFIVPILLGSSYLTLSIADQNPFLSPGRTKPDGQIGFFSQNDTGDCFFLASLIAVAQDSEGQALIESAFHKVSNSNSWGITFPNFLQYPIVIKEQEISSYQLKNTEGDAYSSPVWGDPDVKMLEIAADKLWKKTIKAEGLWDDIPMNAVYMFSNAEQLLIWNKNKVKQEYIQDINKYQRLASAAVNEVEVTSIGQMIRLLKNILAVDDDGISMILIDYINYHAVAIKQIDFSDNSYTTIDTNLNSTVGQNLTQLLLGVINGRYALNYTEIK